MTSPTTRGRETYERPPVERLRQGVGHLQYECIAFHKQGAVMVQMQGVQTVPSIAPDAWVTIKGAMLEAVLLHARCLMMAFREYRGRGFPDDLLFRDYLSAEAWERVRGLLVPDSGAEERIREIGVFLAHISYGRADNDLPARWHAEEYARLQTRIITWYHALEPEWQREFSPLAAILPKAGASRS